MNKLNPDTNLLFDRKFNHDNPTGVAVVIIEQDENGVVSQRPGQHELKQFIAEVESRAEERVIQVINKVPAASLTLGEDFPKIHKMIDRDDLLQALVDKE